MTPHYTVFRTCEACGGKPPRGMLGDRFCDACCVPGGVPGRVLVEAEAVTLARYSAGSVPGEWFETRHGGICDDQSRYTIATALILPSIREES